MSVTEDQLAEMVMDDDGAGCAITSDPAPQPWQWPSGKTFGELSPADRVMATKQAAAQLQDELTRAAPGIAAVLGQA